MRFLLRLSSFLFMLLFLGALVLATLYLVYHAPGPLQDKKVVLIQRGQGLTNIAETLLYEGAICQEVVYCSKIFMFGSLLAGHRGQLKAGEYEIPPRASMADIASLMADGRVLAHQITFPEGLTVKQIAALLQAEEGLTGEIKELPPEGSLLPETFQYIKGDTRQSILGRMKEAKDVFMAEVWPNRAPDLPFKTMQEATTLASIVERETGIAGERNRVAGVYVNRLNQGMKLQSDPTTIYAVSNAVGTLGRELTYKDLATASPYNTYYAAGLPPGPIANPGRASLLAALHPEKHDYIYFVADGTGGHAFGKTLDEHNRNVAKWRKIQRQD